MAEEPQAETPEIKEESEVKAGEAKEGAEAGIAENRTLDTAGCSFTQCMR